MIRLNIFILVDTQNKARIIELAKEVTFPSLNERGCKSYDIFESATRDNVLMICETWSNAESIEAHARTRHFIEFKEAIKDIATIKTEKFDLNNNLDSIH